MKKSLLTLLLAVALTAPVFATDKGAMELDVKAGISIEPILIQSYSSGENCGFTAGTTYSLGADFHYYVVNNLGLGLGINHLFSSDMNESWGPGSKVGATNIYLSVKPVFELQENKFIDKIYFLGHLGYGILETDEFYYNYSKFNELDNGIYWAIGVGVEKYNVIVELMYSVNYSSLDQSSYGGVVDWTYRNVAINIGYKFAL